MRTASWEAAPQIALRDYSKEPVGRRSKYEVLVKADYNTIMHSLNKRFSAGHEDLMSP